MIYCLSEVPLTHVTGQILCIHGCHWHVCCNCRKQTFQHHYMLYTKSMNHILIIKTFIYKLIIENMKMCFQVEMADPRMFTKRSSADLWMWKTSSLNRQRQELLWRANFHRLRAAGSLVRAAWHKMYPTRTENRERPIYLIYHIHYCYIQRHFLSISDGCKN